MSIRFLTAFVSLLFAGFVNCQFLSIEDIDNIVVSRNPDIMKAYEQYASAKASYFSMWSSFLPRASLLTGMSKYDRNQIYFQNDQLIQSDRSYSLSLSASIPLFSGWQDFISLRKAKISMELAKLNFEDNVDKVVYEAKSAYFSFLEAVLSLSVSKEAFDRAEKEFNFIKQRLELGSAAQTDYVKMELQLAQKKFEYIQAQNNVIRARENLAQILGFPLDSTFEIDTTFPTPEENIPQLDTLLGNARKMNKQHKASALSLKSAKLDKYSAWLDYLPSITVSYSWNWGDYVLPAGFSSLTDKGSGSWRISLSWSIFSGTSRIAEIMRTTANLNAQRKQDESTLRSIESSIMELHRTIIEAKAKYELAEAQVKSAKLSYDITEEQYHLGSATVLELVDAQIALTQAQNQRINTAIDFKKALLNLKWICGE